MTRTLLLVLASIAAGAAPGVPSSAQDLAALGVSIDPPAGWRIVVDAAGTTATIARDAADLARAVPVGPRIRVRVGAAALAAAEESPVARIVEEPGEDRISGRPAVFIGLEGGGATPLRRRVFTVIASGGAAYRVDLESPSSAWFGALDDMEGALSSLRFSAPPPRAAVAADTGRGAALSLLDLSTPEARVEAGRRVHAWLSRMIQEVDAGRRILVRVPPPINFLVVDPTRLRIMMELSGSGSTGAGADAVIEADQRAAYAAAIEFRDWLASSLVPYGGVETSAAGGTAASPVASIDPATNAAGATRPTFAAGQPIPVNFSRLPGTYDWLTIVAAGTPDDQFAEWFWSDGSNTPNQPAGAPRQSGRLVFAGLPPGDYEVRLYHDWPAGGYRVRGRRPITVVPAGAPLPQTPTTVLTAPARTAPAGFLGEWRTESSGFTMTVRLWQEGNRVTGRYDYQDGVIEGTLTGVILVFTWRDGSGSNGTGQFVLNADGGTFTGTWLDQTTGRTGTWSGTRVGAVAAAAPPAAAAPMAGAPVTGTLGADFPAALAAQFSNGWTASWTRRGASDDFDVVYQGPGGQQVVTVERISRTGDQIHVQRLSSSDGILCVMDGAIQPDRSTISGTGRCPGVNDGWGFTISTPAQPPSIAAAPACDIAGRWEGNIEGHGRDSWTFTPLGGGAYSAQETGLGNAGGTATVAGRRITIEWQTGPWSGTLWVDLDAACASGAGANIIRTGQPGTYRTTLWRGERTSAATPARTTDFRITGVSVPSSVRANVERGTLTVSWSGNPTFPVRVFFAPDACAPGITCTTEQKSFSVPANPLVFEGAAWCMGISAPIFFDYSVYLEDANGVRTPRANADVTCYP